MISGAPIFKITDDGNFFVFIIFTLTSTLSVSWVWLNWFFLIISNLSWLTMVAVTTGNKNTCSVDESGYKILITMKFETSSRRFMFQPQQVSRFLKRHLIKHSQFVPGLDMKGPESALHPFLVFICCFLQIRKHCCVFCGAAANLVFIFCSQSLWNYSDCCFPLQRYFPFRNKNVEMFP